ncbi:hypothetical protein ABW20_dc0104456 [Dactylellina cionopaga]|nr:hypothetical protein ABW20_dc0104456 [Dactylellina cionopaga]
MGDSYHHHGRRYRGHHRHHSSGAAYYDHDNNGNEYEHHHHHTHTVTLPQNHDTTYDDDPLIYIYAGPHRDVFHAFESVLRKYPYLAERISTLSYGMQPDATVSLEFPSLPSDGVSEVLKWMHRKPVALFVTQDAHVVSSLVNAVWRVAQTWCISSLKGEIIEAIKSELDTGSSISGGDLIRMLTGLYVNASIEDHNFIADAIEFSVKKINVHNWWTDIHHDRNPNAAIYQRLAGFFVKNLRAYFCDRCVLENMPNKGYCICCGKFVPHN